MTRILTHDFDVNTETKSIQTVAGEKIIIEKIASVTINDELSGRDFAYLVESYNEGRKVNLTLDHGQFGTLEISGRVMELGLSHASVRLELRDASVSFYRESSGK